MAVSITTAVAITSSMGVILSLPQPIPQMAPCLLGIIAGSYYRYLDKEKDITFKQLLNGSIAAFFMLGRFQ